MISPLSTEYPTPGTLIPKRLANSVSEMPNSQIVSVSGSKFESRSKRSSRSLLFLNIFRRSIPLIIMWCRIWGACPPSAALQALAGGRLVWLILACFRIYQFFKILETENFKGAPLHTVNSISPDSAVSGQVPESACGIILVKGFAWISNTTRLSSSNLSFRTELKPKGASKSIGSNLKMPVFG